MLLYFGWRPVILPMVATQPQANACGSQPCDTRACKRGSGSCRWLWRPSFLSWHCSGDLDRDRENELNWVHSTGRRLIMSIAACEKHCHSYQPTVVTAWSKYHFNSILRLDGGAPLLLVWWRNNAELCWLLGNQSCVTITVVLFKKTTSTHLSHRNQYGKVQTSWFKQFSWYD